jgi:hypothetical protein
MFDTEEHSGLSSGYTFVNYKNRTDTVVAVDDTMSRVGAGPTVRGAPSEMSSSVSSDGFSGYRFPTEIYTLHTASDSYTGAAQGSGNAPIGSLGGGNQQDITGAMTLSGELIRMSFGETSRHDDDAGDDEQYVDLEAGIGNNDNHHTGAIASDASKGVLQKNGIGAAVARPVVTSNTTNTLVTVPAPAILTSNEKNSFYVTPLTHHPFFAHRHDSVSNNEKAVSVVDRSFAGLSTPRHRDVFTYPMMRLLSYPLLTLLVAIFGLVFAAFGTMTWLDIEMTALGAQLVFAVIFLAIVAVVFGTDE